MRVWSTTTDRPTAAACRNSGEAPWPRFEPSPRRARRPLGSSRRSFERRRVGCDSRPAAQRRPASARSAASRWGSPAPHATATGGSAAFDETRSSPAAAAPGRPPPSSAQPRALPWRELPPCRHRSQRSVQIRRSIGPGRSASGRPVVTASPVSAPLCICSPKTRESSLISGEVFSGHRYEPRRTLGRTTATIAFP